MGAGTVALASHDGPLVGDWHLDFASGDLSFDDSGHNLTGFDTTGTFGPGKFDNALSLNGTGDGFRVPTDPLLGPTGGLSVVVWVKAAASPGTGRRIVSKGTRGCARVGAYGLYTGSTGGLEFAVDLHGPGTGASHTIVRTPPIAASGIWDGSWHAVAGVYDAGFEGSRNLVGLWVDGRQVSAADIPSGVGAIDYAGMSESDVFVGRNSPGEVSASCAGSSNFGGAIDELQIYSRALEAHQVRALNADTQPSHASFNVENTARPQVSGTPKPGNALSCTQGSWNGDSVAVNYAYGWERAPSGTHFENDPAWTPIAGAASPQYTVRQEDVSSRVRCRVTRSDDGGSGEAVSDSLLVQPAGTAPTVTSLTQSSPHGPTSPVAVTANANGNVTSLIWTIGGLNYPSEPDQDTLLLSQRGTTKITVRAQGPGGLGPPKTLIVKPPPLPKDPVTKKIAAAISKAPPVYSWGPKAIQTLVNPKPALKKCKNVNFLSGALYIKGCLQPLTSLDDVPTPERGVLTRVAQKYGIPTEKEAMEKALKMSHAFIGFGPTTMNGVTLSPQSGAAVAGFPQAYAIATSNSKQAIGQLKLAANPNFLINTALKKGVIPFGEFKLAKGSLSKIASFGLGKTISIELKPGGFFAKFFVAPYADIKVNLELPAFLRVGGLKLEGGVHLRADTVSGLVIDSMRIGPLSAEIGPLAVKEFRLDYKKAGDQWRGQGKACVPSGACLDMIPPNGSVVIKNGSLKSAGATLIFPSPGLPVFAGVNLRDIGFRLGLNPTRLGGNARVVAVKIYEIDGRMMLAFPSSRTPFIFDIAEVGPGFPQHLYGGRFDRTTVALAADAKVKVPVIGKIPLGGAYLVYEYPGYVAFGGGTEQTFAKVISMTGRVDGELNASSGRFNISGSVKGCLVKVICRGASGLISSRGLSVCMSIGPLNIGGGIFFKPFGIKLWPLDGCKWSPFAEQNIRKAAFEPGKPYEVKVGPGRQSRAINLEGTTGAPRIRVTGPGGQSLDSPASSGLVTKGALRIIRQEPSKLTVVGLQDPAPGTYKIALLPGSPTVKTLGEATDPPDAKVTAKVSGAGPKRVLSYDILKRPAQQVTFIEVDGDVSRTIGVVKGGGKGTLRFEPAPGRAKRTIVAQFELDGLPAERRTVTTFAPPSLALGKPRGLKVKHAGPALKVSWKPVSAATRYQVVVTSSAGQRVLTTSKRSLKVAKVPKWASGTVGVRALAKLREGKPATRPFKATAKLPTRLEKLPKAPKLG